jgi:hypothetical protein
VPVRVHTLKICEVLLLVELGGRQAEGDDGIDLLLGLVGCTLVGLFGRGVGTRVYT